MPLKPEPTSKCLLRCQNKIYFHSWQNINKLLLFPLCFTLCERSVLNHEFLKHLLRQWRLSLQALAFCNQVTELKNKYYPTHLVEYYISDPVLIDINMRFVYGVEQILTLSHILTQPQLQTTFENSLAKDEIAHNEKCLLSANYF